MAQRITHSEGPPCGSRDSEFSDRYDVEAYLAWLFDQPECVQVVGSSRIEGRKDRFVGDAWRESLIGSLKDGDAARIEEWRGGVRRFAEALLPPQLRPFAFHLVLGPALTELEIPPSRSLDPGDAVELERLAIKSLNRMPPLTSNVNPKLTPAERQRKLRLLRKMDPPRDLHLRLANPLGLRPRPGDPAAVSATSAAIGSWAMHEPVNGYPQVGKVVESDGSGVTVEPEPLPEPRDGQRFDYIQ